MSHTPGPWVVIPDPHDDGRCWGIETHDGQVIVESDSGTYPPKIADALLIAAAPELLEALEQMVGTYGVGHTSPALQSARAAIAKAKGKTT